MQFANVVQQVASPRRSMISDTSEIVFTVFF